MAGTEEALLKRVLPHSMEAEQSVICSMLMDREAITIASEIIHGDDFYGKQYGMLFDTMVELNDEGKPVDLVVLQERLKEKDVPPEVSSLEFMKDLLSAYYTSANIKHYANIVAEKATLRKLIRLNEEIANTCYVGNESLETILEDTEKRVFELVQKRNTGEFVPIRQVVMNAMDKIERASKSDGNVTGVATGFIDLDYKTAGMQPSDLILIAARPSMGKTAFVLNIAQHVAFKLNQTIAIFSLEMSKEQLVNRLFSLESRVDAQHLRTGNLTDAEWEKLIEGAGVIGKSGLIIDDTPGISVPELRSKCRKYKLEHDLNLIVIDYLQLMSGSGRGSDSRQQEISDISRSLKALARELNVPVIALSQLSRAVEQRPDHRPMLSDLRESGAIEQDADVVMFIYRDEYYNKDSEKKGIAEIIIAKQRNGPIGTVELVWLPDYTKFANLQK
ncbi:replicative DNA helicase [Parablautia intestinalis]|jgi:replicative DNA helicase|uniref:Replicative DNA helicase n=1 Tax=Parablautia intestinalis TaxID=2320100 RepID=A0A3A9AQ42_9FIRM|nr:replicative DNA helicase [Parablautia intestinalis]MCI8616123.1 replicative DNA helicase [Lachnospiraceae bacterium]MDE7049230.1 replicative DNA helicase [Lachnospiraceae bacterium]RKI89376.1 replicative DNA helicase [Parablautia intestinalis]